MNIIFKVHNGQKLEELSSTDIAEYAKFYGLDSLIPGRYSSLFIVNLITLEKGQGIDSHSIIEEIKCLEGIASTSQTKPPSQFRGEFLKGLWHKHFFPALPSVFGYNITNHFGKNGIRNLVEEVLDSAKSSTLTKEMINELSHRLVQVPLEDRAAENKLTGEWIVYAKEDDKNYYLCISPHSAEDKTIASNIQVACAPEFPFLKKYEF